MQRQIIAKPAGFVSDVQTVASRALRSLTRDVEGVIPAVIIPVFFYFANVGALQDFAEQMPGLDYKAFQLPTAILFAVTGISRAIMLVMDIQGGYFDRLSLTPVNRVALLLGLMVADLAMVLTLTTLVVIMGLVTGVRFETGPLGILAFVALSGAWGLAFTGFPYAVALKTGSPAVVNTSWLVLFPFMFLTTAMLPKEALTGWMATVATYNPFTYALSGLRSLIAENWNMAEIMKGVLAVGGVGLVNTTLALTALRGRVCRR